MGALLRKRGLPCPIFGGSTSLPWPACFEFRECFSRVLPRPVGTTLHRRAAAQDPRHGPARNPRPSFQAGPHGIYRRGGPEARSKCSNGGQRGSRSSQDDCKVVRFAPTASKMAGLQGWNCGFPLSRERRVGADSTMWKDFAIVLKELPLSVDFGTGLPYTRGQGAVAGVPRAA